MQPNQNNLYDATTGQVGIASDSQKVLRNTYSLLSMTLLFSAVMAGVGMAMNIGIVFSMVLSFAGIGILWFVMPKVENSASGIYWTFGFTGIMGLSLAPILNHYLAAANGGMIVLQALAGTAITFLSLSAYVHTTKKDFSFLRGFIVVGMTVAILGSLGLIAMSFFGSSINIQGFSLAISAGVTLLMSALILYETGNIIHGHQTNYINATISLYLSLLNLFTSLLHLIGAFGSDD